jgi:hypothetical protein
MPAAIVSIAIFVACASLTIIVRRIDRRAR